MKLTTKVSEILISNNNSGTTFADTFVFEPAEAEEAKYGHLLILVSFAEKTKKTPEISEAIASILQNSYYTKSGRDPELQFEAAVKKVNEVLGDLASAGEVSWVGQLDAVVLAVANEQVFLSSVGNAKAYIIRRNQLSQLNTDTSTVPLKPNPLKTFQNIIIGQAEKGDKFVCVSPNVLEYIEKAKVKDIAVRFTPDIAARHFHSRLISFKDKDSFAALIAGVTEDSFKKPSVAVPARPPKSTNDRPAPKADVPKQNITPKNTSLKTSSGRLAKTTGLFKGWASKTAAATQGLFRKDKTTRDQRKQTPDKKSNEPISSRKPFTYTDTRPKPWWKKFGIMIKNIGAEIGRRFLKWFKKLPRTSKILFIVVVVLLIAFLISLAAVRGNQKSAERRAYYENLTNEAAAQEEEAEAAIIYGNDDKARNLLTEAKAKADEVQSSDYPSEEAAAVLAQIETDYQRMDHIKQINDPETLVDFTTLGEGVNATDLAISGDKLVSTNSEQNTLYIYDEETKETKAVEVEADGNIKSLTSSPDEISLATNAPALIRYDFSGDTAPKVSADLEEDQNITAISLFGNRLYILDSLNNEIIRMSEAIGGFSKGTNWLEEDADLSQAVDLSIDGSIYVLNSDGSVRKFLRGLSNDFNIENLSTPLSNPTHIFTDDETNHIYILDPENRRLVELDKEGNLLNQYLSDSFTDIRGMAINEADKKAYILNENQILGIKLAD